MKIWSAKKKKREREKEREIFCIFNWVLLRFLDAPLLDTSEEAQERNAELDCQNVILGIEPPLEAGRNDGVSYFNEGNVM